ncbi:MAG TPA: RNA polymerase sigma factor [Patescibacteria group bacterium]|nr:RNA polymerase sigma factor [Patescibacteria group bacterium]
MKSLNFEENLLLLRLKKKDPDAFAQLYDLYVTPIYRFIYFKVPRTQDAEDLTSEVFLKIWQYISTTEDVIGNLRALLYKTARNSVIDFYRRSVNREISGAEEILQTMEDLNQQSVLTQIETRLEMKNIESVLKQMKDDYREVIILRFVEDLPITEIAKIMDKSRGSVRVLIHRAIKVMRGLIAKNGKKSF